MRDLKAFAELPTRTQLRQRIGAERSFRPQPRPLRPIERRLRDDGYFDLVIEGFPTRRVHPMIAEAHRLLDEGVPLDDIVARVHGMWERGRPKLVARILRSYMMELYEAGVVDIPFEPPPDVFAGRFEREKLLGRGGMGVVYLCRDLEDGGRPVVLKHSWGWSSNIESADLMNRREAAALSVLDHPLIPRLVKVFEERGLVHVVRAYADGRPLIHKRHETKLMTSRDRLRVVRDTVESVHHMHERGLVYLDVKPENYLASDEDGRIRIIDLGLCRPIGPTGEATVNGPLGSRGYAAPEVVWGRHVISRKADVFGLGRMMFFLALGTRPRSKQTARELSAAMLAAGADPREAALAAEMAEEDPAKRLGDLSITLSRIDAILADGAA